MTYSNRIFLYGPFGLFVALAAGIMIYWWVAATALSQRLDTLNGHEIVPGIRLSFGSKRIAGFPFRLDAIFDNLNVQIADARGPITWHSDRFATHALTYQTSQTILEAAGQQQLRWTGETGRPRIFTFTPGTLRASAIVDDGRLTRFDIDSIAFASSNFAAARAQFHLRRDPAIDALDLVLDLQSVRFAGDAANGFAKGLSRIRIEGRLSPATPFTAVLSGNGAWRPAVEKWRDAPGGFKIDEAEFGWGHCEASGSGAVTLDDVHRPSGSLAFGLTDCDALAKQAAGIKAQSRAHRAILTTLADLAGHVPADRSGALPLEIVFKDGLIFVGPGTASGGNAYFEPVGFLHALY